jgi:hypothetical protein
VIPPRWIEKIVEILTPPAYREVLPGDLRERYRSILHYISDGWYAIPCVIYSRARRVCDPGVLLLEGILLYLSFIAAAWLYDHELLFQSFGLLKLAIPVPMALAALGLADVYAPAPSTMRPPLRATMHGLIAAALAWLSGMLFALQLPILVAGSAFGLIGIAAIAMLFQPNDPRPRPH